MSPDQALVASLARSVARRLGDCRIRDLRRLSGGASQETWSFDAELEGAPAAAPLILRRAPAGRRSSTAVSPEMEARVQAAAGRAGVPVADVRFTLEPEDELGRGYVMDRIEGESIARRILREPELAEARARMARQCGEILATVHATPTEGLDLPTVDGPGQIAQYRELYLSFDEPRPIFDLAFERLKRSLPSPERVTLVHGDFRNGNLLVGPQGVRAVLDWELVHRGDPMEDLGWLCVPSWRFGEVERPVGGFGSLEDLYAGYEAGSGQPVDRERVLAWQLFGTLKWGVMCMIQGFSGVEEERRSVEKVAIGRRVSETEADLTRLLAPEIDAEDEPARVPSALAIRDERPSTVELVDAVRGFLERELRPELEGKRSFDALVAANALGIVSRELAGGADHDALEREGLIALLGDEPALRELSTGDLARALCERIRASEIASNDTDLLRFLRRSADRKLAIDNPRYRTVPVR